MSRYFLEGLGQAQSGEHYFIDMHTLEQCHAQAKAKRKTKPGCGALLALPGMRDCLFDGIDTDNEILYNKCLTEGGKACDDFAKVVQLECGQHFPQSPVLPPNKDTTEEAEKWKEHFNRPDIWQCYVRGACVKVGAAEVIITPGKGKYYVVAGLLALTAFLLRKR